MTFSTMRLLVQFSPICPRQSHARHQWRRSGRCGHSGPIACRPRTSELGVRLVRKAAQRFPSPSVAALCPTPVAPCTRGRTKLLGRPLRLPIHIRRRARGPRSLAQQRCDNHALYLLGNVFPFWCGLYDLQMYMLCVAVVPLNLSTQLLRLLPAWRETCFVSALLVKRVSWRTFANSESTQVSMRARSCPPSSPTGGACADACMHSPKTTSAEAQGELHHSPCAPLRKREAALDLPSGASSTPCASTSRRARLTRKPPIRFRLPSQGSVFQYRPTATAPMLYSAAACGAPCSTQLWQQRTCNIGHHAIRSSREKQAECGPGRARRKEHAGARAHRVV